MPQELHVVQCFSCSMFQVDIVKKVPKWTCKMCGEKQTLKKVFLTGTGKECRSTVQQLNQQTLSKTESAMTQESSKNHPENRQHLLKNTIPGSKWGCYVRNEVEERNGNDNGETVNNVSQNKLVSSKWEVFEQNENFEKNTKQTLFHDENIDIDSVLNV